MPIASREDLERYLEGDAWAHGMYPYGLKQALSLTGTATVLRHQRRLRRLEYLINCKRGPGWRAVTALYRLRVRRSGIRLGFSIPPNVFGPALCLPHWGTIVVSPEARVGGGCRLHPSTTLAWSKGGAPTVGENAFIGPGARLVGDVTLGDFVVVGANAVVTRSFDEDGIVLGGVPATVIGARGTDRDWIA